MKIFINATTCVVGGGAQVAASFIGQAMDDNRHQFVAAVSKKVREYLGNMADTTCIYELASSPARPFKGMKSRRFLKDLELKFKPDVVFTIFGPAYHNFRAPHACGIADPWVTHPSSLATSRLGVFGRLKMKLQCLYKKWRLSINDFYWTETEVARQGLIDLIGLDADKILTIPNCYSPLFDSFNSAEESHNSLVKIFTLSATYPHKNLMIIPEMASILYKRGLQDSFKFVVTLPENGFGVNEFWKLAKKLGVCDLIENIGHIPLESCPLWYSKTDILFLPTLLETFSVTFLEAMKMSRPIVTTNLDFARDICGDAAEYFEPLDAESAVDAIITVGKKTERYNELVLNGINQLKQFPNPAEKYNKHIQWLEKVVMESTKLRPLFKEAMENDELSNF